jgi:hypothetical protein
MPLLPSLVSPEELRDAFGDKRVRVFDATVFLRRTVDGGPYTVESGRESYARAHLPGAGFADIPGALSDPASPFSFTLPAAEYFAAAIGRLGVGDSSHVVAYTQDAPMWATRLQPPGPHSGQHQRAMERPGRPGDEPLPPPRRACRLPPPRRRPRGPVGHRLLWRRHLRDGRCLRALADWPRRRPAIRRFADRMERPPGAAPGHGLIRNHQAQSGLLPSRTAGPMLMSLTL